MWLGISSGAAARTSAVPHARSSNPDGTAARSCEWTAIGVGEVNLMDLSLLCGLLQPFVDLVQTFVSLAYLPLNWIGIGTPPVSSWFQPFLPCTLS